MRDPELPSSQFVNKWPPTRRPSQGRLLWAPVGGARVALSCRARPMYVPYLGHGNFFYLGAPAATGMGDSSVTRPSSELRSPVKPESR